MGGRTGVPLIVLFSTCPPAIAFGGNVGDMLFRFCGMMEGGGKC